MRLIAINAFIFSTAFFCVFNVFKKIWTLFIIKNDRTDVTQIVF